ncbi:hypothetical protein DPMN_098300 [Dreissena polymorpha]|uniref:Uncharacterized protein n=1 Tax=Dreissena polymorpha TaxID=45954 RepID=A0A9D4LCS5_DREPO|nr:hypothetical protein DPMN_098298 [Dreissena polymorpha]KAH3855730.1 hypothetical protein DPMN_098300 [Dreissena polymorpha]
MRLRPSLTVMPVEPQCVIRHLPGCSIKMFNTSGMNRESPGRTGNDRRGTGNNRDCTGNNTPRQSYGNAPVEPR